MMGLAVFKAILWGVLAGLTWARGSWVAAATICSGRRSAMPLLFKASTILFLYLGLAEDRAMWPFVLIGLVAGGAALFAGGLLVRHTRLR